MTCPPDSSPGIMRLSPGLGSLARVRRSSASSAVLASAAVPASPPRTAGTLVYGSRRSPRVTAGSSAVGNRTVAGSQPTRAVRSRKRGSSTLRRRYRQVARCTFTSRVPHSCAFFAQGWVSTDAAYRAFSAATWTMERPTLSQKMRKDGAASVSEEAGLRRQSVVHPLSRFSCNL